MKIITKKLFFQRNSQMSEKSTNGCREKYKKQNDKNQKKNIFDQNFIKNEFWGPKLPLSEPPRTRKHQKLVSTITRRYFSPQIQKHTDHF